MPNVPSWLNTAVIYEIYPPSFYDTNSDGIGDIPGIIAKLDYVKSLGCNTLWLNPCFASPFMDGGYDITDYYKVAPRYGTNEDLFRLFEQAKQRGIRVLLDLVPGHTSTQHPWFIESAKPEKNKYTNWYVWSDWTWQSPGKELEGIKGFSDRNAQYATNFFYFQPALNYGFANPDPASPWQLPIDHPDVLAVREEMKNIMRFWLDRGASGFRVDMAASLVKNDPGSKANAALWREVRAMLDRDYPEAVIISEWCSPCDAIPAGFHVDMCLPFHPASRSLLREPTKGDNVDYSKSFFHSAGAGDCAAFFDWYCKGYEATRNLGYSSIVVGNHDTVRINDNRSDNDLEIIYAFVFTMPGVPIFYAGDEIGMRHRRGIVSKEGGYERTAARTPMQWDETQNAGFSSAPSAKNYLPVDTENNDQNAAAQFGNPDSLLVRIRRLIALRSKHDALGADGEFELLHAKPHTYPLVYLRKAGLETFLIALNPAGKHATVMVSHKDLRGQVEQVAGFGTEISMSKKNTVKLEMQGVSYGVFKIAE